MELKWYQMVAAIIVTTLVIATVVSTVSPFLANLVVIAGILGGAPSVIALGDDFPFVKSEREDAAVTEPQTPVEELREQYAEGQITEEEFETRLDELVGLNQEKEAEVEYEREF